MTHRHMPELVKVARTVDEPDYNAATVVNAEKLAAEPWTGSAEADHRRGREP
jgi:hypothetical protein